MHGFRLWLYGLAVPAGAEEAVDQPLQIEVRREVGGRIYARVLGGNTFANVLAYWHAIADEVGRRPASELLLVDELVEPALGADEWHALVAEVGPRLGRLRIAHVKPNGLDTVEHCVLAAMEAGLEAQVFVNEQHASVWLRYGRPAN